MDKKEIAYQIGNFSQKQLNSPRVKKPDWEYEIVGIKNIHINEDSLEKFGKIWIFTAIVKIDKKNSMVITPATCKLAGNATIKETINSSSQKLIEVESVNFTFIKEIKETEKENNNEK